MKLNPLNLPFPYALIALPVNEITILGVVLLFTSSKKLGFKKVSPKIIVIVSIAAVLLIFLAAGIGSVETRVFGPDPSTDQYRKLIQPKDAFQLVALVAINLVLVGPIEEAAFRGFVQRGFENSLGKLMGLFAASVLFGLVHGLDSLYNIVPVFAAGLILGYVWQKTGGNTTASALMHGVYNSTLLILSYFLATA
jgi:membrane protease YdiL (CAAX protease family)